MKHAITHHQSGVASPLGEYNQWRSELSGEQALLLVEFNFSQYWLPGKPQIRLTAIYYFGGEDKAVQVSVTSQGLTNNDLSPGKQYAHWAVEHGFACVRIGEVLDLVPCFIAKPWGQEIWFTGVEERGVCAIKSDEGQTLLPWMQTVMPDAAIGVPEEPLVLLKILDPVGEPVTGDLYFELHEEKREVYVVTHIDSDAWPDGVGYIRYGFCADKLASYHSDDAFRQAYRSAVGDYERVRRKLDDLPDVAGQASLREQEVHLRREMDSFTQLLPLRAGDVVCVPLLTPHSLQHGVRTIEFQTPVYERKILSFAQKVLTQNHWDTEEAVAQMLLETPEMPPAELLYREEGILVERIVDFKDFEVRRVFLRAGQRLSKLVIEDYALIIVLEGILVVNGKHYAKQEALILPRSWADFLQGAQPTAPLVFLLAMPRY